MSTVTVNVPTDVMHWIESRVRSGKFASTDDYLRNLVIRDREREATDEERIEALRLIVEDAERSGISDKTIDDIKIEGERIARERGLL